MSRTRYLPAALAAIDNIYTYTLEHWGAVQAEGYVGGLFDLCAVISERNHRPIPEEFEVDGFVTSYRHHRIYWRRAEDGDVIIVFILHEAMDVAKWLDRHDF